MKAGYPRRAVSMGAVLLVLSLGTAACGDGSKGEDGSEAGGPGVSAAGGGGREPAGRATDEQAVRAVLQDVGSRIQAGDYVGVCRLMTSATRAQVAEAVEGAEGKSGAPPMRLCGEALEASLGDGVAEDLDPPITSVEIDGDRAVVTAQPSHDDRPQSAQLRREGGDWRLETFYAN